MKQAIYSLSADPFTLGHLDIIKRASAMVDCLWVVIANNLNKDYLFSLEERKALVEQVLTREVVLDKSMDKSMDKSVCVDSCSGLLADYALQKGVRFLIRSMRDASDFSYERRLSFFHQGQHPLEMLYLMASDKYQSISSGFVKATARDGGDVITSLPLVVKKALEKKMFKRFPLAITGSIATGKTTVGKALYTYLKSQGYACFEIDLDAEVVALYDETQQGLHQPLVQAIVHYFGVEVLSQSNNSDKKGIDKKKLSALVFARPNPKNALLFLQKTLSPFLMSRYRDKVRKHQGLILINAPMVVEYGLLPLVNNEVVLVEVPVQVQIERLRQRDNLNEENAKQKIKLSNPSEVKRRLINKIIEKYKHGKMWVYDNRFPLELNNAKNKKSNSAYSNKTIELLAADLIDYFQLPKQSVIDVEPKKELS